MSLWDISALVLKEPTMSIPFWRTANYSDDGCSIFECLSCYRTWELRGSPNNWKYCPFCGTIWLGEKTTNPVKYYDDPAYRTERIFPLSFRIEEKYIDSEGSSDLPWKTLYGGLKGAEYANDSIKDLRKKEQEDYKEYPFLGRHIYRIRIDKKLL